MTTKIDLMAYWKLITKSLSMSKKKKTKKKLMTRVYECANGLLNCITNEIFSKRNIDHNLIN